MFSIVKLCNRKFSTFRNIKVKFIKPEIKNETSGTFFIQEIVKFPGDKVKKGEIVMKFGSGKAAIDERCLFDGTIKKVGVINTDVNEGDVIYEMDVD